MKKLYVYLFSVFLLSSVVTISIVFYNKPEKRNSVSSNISKAIPNKKEKCPSVDYNYKVSLVNESNVESIETCITCDDKELSSPTKEGYDFDGWYYEKDFKTKVNTNKLKELVKKEKKENNCLVGYEDITLYAKWNEKPKEEVKEETNTPTQEVVQNVQIEEQPTIEEQKLPQEKVEEEIPNTCEIKKPVEYGKFLNYSEATNSNHIYFKYNYFINTSPREDVYSSTCGKVYYIKSYISKFNYVNNEIPERVYDIYTASILNGEIISIVYLEVAESNVRVNDIITNETKLGRSAYLSKNVFIHRLPYINIFIKKGKSNPYKTTESDIINPQSFMSLPSNEFWNGR